MLCKHNYKVYFKATDTFWCFDCKTLLSSAWFPKVETKKYKKLIGMPPIFEDFTSGRWYELSPWSHISYQLAKNNMFYFGCLYDKEYIILPVLRSGNPVFYQARSIDKNINKKYKYMGPKGVAKQAWFSQKQNINGPIFICEGIADAVYMSQFGNSMAIMGLNINSETELLIKEYDTAVLCLDNDFPGDIAALSIALQLRKYMRIYYLSLEKGKDPTEYSFTDMEKLIKGIGL